jgi:hypothetical protein
MLARVCYKLSFQTTYCIELRKKEHPKMELKTQDTIAHLTVCPFCVLVLYACACQYSNVVWARTYSAHV